jgi:spermidine/putrescine transport system substrate-binding protein
MSDTIRQRMVEGLATGALTRRKLMQVLASVGVGFATLPMTRRGAQADSSLAVQSWSGYDIPELAPEFYAKHGTPSFTLMASDNEGFEKVRGGFTPDLTHHTSFMLQKLRDADLIQPIDPARLRHWDNFFPEIRSVGAAEDKNWIAPCSWGNSSVIYRRDLVELKEESWGLLWDDRYAGRLAGRDSAEYVQIAGLFTQAKDPWAMTDPEFEKAKEALVAQKPLLRFYWSSQTELEQSLASGEVVAAYGWNASVALLRKQGIDMAMLRPKEGLVTWTDGLVLYKNHPGSEDLAYEFMNAYMSPEVGKFLIEAYGYGSGNTKAFELVPASRLEELGITEPAKILATSWFQKATDADHQKKAQAILDSVKFS